MPLITIKMAYAILITSVTGTVFLLIWLLAGFLLKKAGYLDTAYKLLRILPAFFLLPLPFVLLDILNERTEWWGGVLFLHTAKLLLAARVILIIWCIGVTAIVVKYIWDRVHIANMLSHATVCKMTTRGILAKVCKKLHIPENSIGLLEAYEIPSPATMRIIHPVIVIPCDDYTEAELEVIFYHELTHYQHKDVLFKYVLAIVCCLNFFNPLVWLYRKVVVECMEAACDDCARKSFGKIKEYAFAIIAIAGKEIKHREIALGNSVSQKPLGRRINNMLNYSKVKQQSKGLAALLVAAAILFAGAGSTVVAAASADQYVDLYNNTCVLVEEDTVYEPGIEYVDENPSFDGLIVEEGEVSVDKARSSVISFSWTVSPGVLKKTPSLYCTKGQGIQVVCLFTPSTQNVRLGILEPDGTKRFLQNSGPMSHTFSLTKTGYYYVFVENISSSVTMTANGSYCSVD